MKTTLFTSIFTFMFFTIGLGQAPVAPVKVVTEDYFGQKIDDPYRYMENLEDPLVESWMKGQADYARQILDRIPGRKGLIEKMKAFDQRQSWSAKRVLVTEKQNQFFIKEEANEETGKLYFKKGWDGDNELIFDPATFRPGSDTLWKISGFSPNDEETLIVIGLTALGKEISTLILLDLKTGKLLPESIPRTSPNVSWLRGGKRFLYTQTQSDDIHSMASTMDSEIMMHTVDTDWKEDRAFFSRTLYPELDIKPEEYPIVFYDKYADVLLASALSVERNLTLFMAPGSEVDNKKINWTILFDESEQVQYLDMDDKNFYLWTCKNAPNFKCLSVPIKDFHMSKATVLIPEDKEWILDGMYLTKSGVLYTVSRRSLESTLWFKPWGKPARQVELPFPASTVSLYGQLHSYRKNEALVFLGGWTSPTKRYRYFVDEDRFELAMISPSIEYPEYDDLVVEELMVPSHDGVEVPLSLIYKKGLKKDGKAPLLMLGYGAYGYPYSPSFKGNQLLWTLEGGIIAVAHVRGGGELGNNWYLAGKKTTKPNTWKDLIACAEYLHKNAYSSPAKTAINSASAGGILIGRAMTERPDLFAVAIPKVGCLNPLRQEHSPNGPVNIPEFGSSKNEEECKALIEMDAYLHLKEGVKYPATLVTAGFNDPRVIAWEPAKFAAKLQAYNASDNPVLFRVDYSGGHSTSDTKTQLYEDWADMVGFSLWQMGHPNYQPDEITTTK